jgi:hypothetical protein
MMEIKEIGIGTLLRRRGLRERGMIEITEDPKSGNYILIIGKGIRQKWYRKWLKVNIPEAMWQIKCSKDEIPTTVNKFLSEKILV